MEKRIEIKKIIDTSLDHCRLDQALAILCPMYSRAQIQNWIRCGWVKVNQQVELKPRTLVKSQQVIEIDADLPLDDTWQAQPIPLKIVYEDEDLIVIDKPAGLVVHPGAGNPQDTLVNALLHHDPQLAMVPRAGLVHRLDKETSGLLVVARNLSAHHDLVKKLQNREVKREYEAIANGIILKGGTIHTLMGRHPVHRTKMSVVPQGKPAITHYQPIKQFRAHTHVRIQLETGRTHQIRVHFAYIKHPLAGDPEYGSKNLPVGKFSSPLLNFLATFSRQALHAVSLTLAHPRNGEILTWNSPLPEDFNGS